MAHTARSAAIEPTFTPVSRKSLLVAAFSTIVEWYDFTLYIYFSTVLARVFFGGGAQSLVLTLGGFAVAYLMRPIGAMVFGHIGDRHGRRHMLLLSMALMSGAMLLTALLPTHSAVGPMAAWLLLLLRCVMGFSVGGEYTGVVAYLLEGARKDRRGLTVSLAVAASEVGALLAVGISALTVSLFSPSALDAWGWRVPFLIGSVLAAIIFVSRAAMEESPDFSRRAANGTLPKRPLRHALTTHRAGIARGFAISALGSITYYVGITYVPAFLHAVGGTSERAALNLATAAAAAVILITPIVGWLCDRIGRKPLLIALTIASAVAPISLFTMMANGTTAQALTGAIVLAMLAGAFSTVGAVTTAEQFTGEARVSGLALGTTVATAIFGGATPYVAEKLVQYTGQAQMPGIMIAVVALCVLPVTVTLVDRHGG